MWTSLKSLWCVSPELPELLIELCVTPTFSFKLIFNCCQVKGNYFNCFVGKASTGI